MNDERIFFFFSDGTETIPKLKVAYTNWFPFASSLVFSFGHIGSHAGTSMFKWCFVLVQVQ